MGIIPPDVHGTPVPGATDISDPYALSPAWQNGADFKKPFDYQLDTTGQRVQLMRLDMGDLLKLGIAEELDFMSRELITSPGANVGKQAVSDAVLKADNFTNMERMINLVCSAGILKPKLHMPPTITETANGTTTTKINESARQPGLIYLDSIPFGDRMELFSVIFDSDGLATFRSEQESGVGNVEHVQSVQLPADRPVDELRPQDAEGVLSQ